MKKYTLLRTFMLFIAALILCGWFSIHTQAAITKGVKAPEQTVCFEPDTTSVLKNPLTGWVMYLGRAWDENFWQTQRYDAMPVNGGDSTVRVSDYAGTCYIRINWNMLESKEGKYVWNDPDSRIYKLLASVRERGMRLAFRINVDSRDQGQNTPLYVKDAVFQQKYEKFLQAFAVAFDDPDKVDFIDAYGLGKWGEAHGVKYNDYSKKEEVFEWITDVYTKAFKRVPLVINYHRLVGDTISWAKPHPDSKRLLERAIAKGYIIRHDAFGMTGYYEQWEKDFARAYRYRLPIIMEGGWITGAHHRYWIDPSGKYREGHSEDVRLGEYEESRNAHVNMMDLRTGDEVASWFNTSFDLVNRFVREGGYRLYPTKVSFVNKARQGELVSMQHNWRNLGWGYCPTNIPQWKGKYKVCIALMDTGHSIVKKQIAEEADLSAWVQGCDGHYTTNISLEGLQKGSYTWLIGLVDTTKAYQPGLKMAVDKNLLFDGWCKVGTLEIGK